MNGCTSNIMDETLNNTNFRKVLFTGSHMQLVVMCLKPGEDIGSEVHDHVDQFFRVEEGECKVEIDENEYVLTDDMVVIVPAGSRHNVTNISDSEDLKLYTIYSPANHPDGTVHTTREEAMIAEEEEHHH